MATIADSSVLQGFLSWWRNELAGMLPRRSHRPPASDAAVLVMGSDGFRLIERHRAQARSDAANGAVPLELMLDILSRNVGSNEISAPLTLRLAPSSCLIRTLEVPLAARHNAARLLAMDLERSTPLKPADVLAGHDVRPKPGHPGMLIARSFIVKRKTIEPVADVVEGIGVPIQRIEVMPDDADSAVALTTLPLQGLGPVATGPAAKVNLVLGAAIVALGLAAGYLYLERHEKALASLQEATSGLKSKVQARKAASSKADAEAAILAGYARLRAEYVSRAVMLEELSRILPDTAWVSEMRVDGATLDISGQAKSAAALLPLIESSKHFVDATLSTSVTFDPREEKERFSIRAHIRGVPPEGSRP